MEVNDRPICRNQTEIGKYIGIDPKKIPFLKRKYGLPAFQIDGKGPYKALKSSLTQWLEQMESQFL